MGASVLARSSPTIAAVIAAIFFLLIARCHSTFSIKFTMHSIHVLEKKGLTAVAPIFPSHLRVRLANTAGIKPLRLLLRIRQHLL